MNNLTSEQLADLTDRINGRLGEWGFPRDHTGIIDRLPRGVVRLVYDAIKEWEGEERW